MEGREAKGATRAGRYVQQPTGHSVSTVPVRSIIPPPRPARLPGRGLR